MIVGVFILPSSAGGYNYGGLARGIPGAPE